MSTSDTIAAIATPPGRGGIGIIRVSGKNARDILGRFFSDGEGPLRPRVAMMGGIGTDPANPLDRGIVIWFPSPASYTGEDVVEFQIHGSPFVLDQLLTGILETGLARLAEPGEFTRRAFLNGKLDLTDAERIHLMIQAETAVELQVASTAGGPLRLLIGRLREELVQAMSALEAAIEYPEEGETAQACEQSETRVDRILETLDELATGYERYGRWLGGIRVALAGIPNAGKSSLLNRIVGFDRAIVTELPGTTTDTVDVTVDLKGLRVSLVDTAGLREARGEIEQAGLEKSHAEYRRADLVIGVLDPTVDRSLQMELMDHIPADKRMMVINKADLMSHNRDETVLQVSAKTGQGIADLLDRIVRQFNMEDRGEAFLFTVRQSRAVGEATDRLQEGRHALQTGAIDLATAELAAGLWHLDSLVGRVTTDEILDHVFGEFCLGK